MKKSDRNSNFPQSWDQLEEESSSDYSDFLFYALLGPSRSLDKAYLDYRKKRDGDKFDPKREYRVSGSWAKKSIKFNWKDRGERGDAELMRVYGRQIIANFMQALQIVSEKTLRKIEQFEPNDWSEALATLRAVGGYITGEAIEEFADYSQAREEAEGEQEEETSAEKME